MPRTRTPAAHALAPVLPAALAGADTERWSSYQLGVSPSWTLAELKGKISQFSTIPSAEMKIIVGGKALVDDEKTLGSERSFRLWCCGGMVFVSLRVRGGGAGAPSECLFRQYAAHAA